MKRTQFLRLVPLTLVLVLAGCASSDDGANPAPGPDDMTPQEVAVGQTSKAPEAEAPVAEDAPLAMPEDVIVITSPPESSASFIDEQDSTFPPPPDLPPGVINPDDLDQTESCQRAVGYRSGHKFNICVTTIDGKYVEVNTARAYLRMRSAARHVGVHLTVVSGFRTMASQRYLYGCYLSKRCNNGNLAAVPGYSNHQSGHALDLNTASGGVYSWLVNHGHSYGFRRTVPSERWHWEH